MSSFISIQAVPSCVGEHPFQSREAALAKHVAKLGKDTTFELPQSSTTPALPTAVLGALAALPHGCSPAQSEATARAAIEQLIALACVMSEDEFEAACSSVREHAFAKCNASPSPDLLTAAIAWAKQTHGIVLRVPPAPAFKKTPLCTAAKRVWYLCGSADLVGDDLAVLVKPRLHRLQYGLPAFEAVTLQALMCLEDATEAAVLEVHPDQGMTLQRIHRDTADWARLKHQLIAFIADVCQARSCHSKDQVAQEILLNRGSNEAGA
jgi:hypothetical protein